MYVYTAVRGRYGRAHAPHVCIRVCARVRVRLGAHAIRAATCERLRVGVDRGWLGAQAFSETFNANIGAWNTASVTTLSAVCAAFSARRSATAGGTCSGGVFDAARAVVRGRLLCAAVWARAFAGVHSMCVGIAARSKDGIHDC